MTLETLLDRFAAMAGRTLGENLLGVYLHGSAVMGCFNPDKSDVDLLLAVEREIPDEVKRAFLEGVLDLNGAAPAKGLELSIVRREFCKPFVHPMPYELHFSNAHLDWLRRDMAGYVRNMKGTDPDLAAHVTILNHRGVTLWGLPIAEVFGEVQREDYVDAIWQDVQNARKEVGENPMYITLNLCRVLAYLRDGLILSKREGGVWGNRAFPAYSGLLERALGCYGSGGEMASGTDAVEFADVMLGEIRQNL